MQKKLGETEHTAPAHSTLHTPMTHPTDTAIHLLTMDSCSSSAAHADHPAHTICTTSTTNSTSSSTTSSIQCTIVHEWLSERIRAHTAGLVSSKRPSENAIACTTLNQPFCMQTQRSLWILFCLIGALDTQGLRRRSVMWYTHDVDSRLGDPCAVAQSCITMHGSRFDPYATAHSSVTGQHKFQYF